MRTTVNAGHRCRASRADIGHARDRYACCRHSADATSGRGVAMDDAGASMSRDRSQEHGCRGGGTMQNSGNAGFQKFFSKLVPISHIEKRTFGKAAILIVKKFFYKRSCCYVVCKQC